MGVALQDFLDHKGMEYAPFDPKRAEAIFYFLKPKLSLSSYNIHIVGTNGKGSTGRFLALALLQKNKSVLHFSSPHLFSFNERFYKNGENIDAIKLQEAHQYLQQFDFIKDASYFEYATCLALVLSQDVEYFIIEAGLGGEFDSTAYIDAKLSIFTSISKDHQEFLGESIEEIATTKLNVMRNIAIIAQQKDKKILEIAQNIAKKKNTLLLQVQEYSKDFIHQQNIQEILNLYNIKFLQENLLNALCALKFLGFEMPCKKLILDLRGRFEIITQHIIVDVGHNLDASIRVKEALKDKKVVLIYNSYKQKDVAKILEVLQPNLIRVEIFQLQHPRMMHQKKLEEILKNLKIDYQVFQRIEKQTNYLVFGSFSIVEAFLRGGYA